MDGVKRLRETRSYYAEGVGELEPRPGPRAGIPRGVGAFPTLGLHKNKGILPPKVLAISPA